ncbi:hypothetical protein DRO54_06380 [Candidatus Bathyarchaeota archaeon]|nr:MAG: hypothetical protein DRO54_06380 [Candidatus Bathyarchaeota archaeon]
MSLKGIWRPRPLETLVVELLQKKGGTITDTELLDMLRSLVGDGVSFPELNRTLMNLEIAGLIYVSGPVRGKRRIELKKKS